MINNIRHIRYIDINTDDYTYKFLPIVPGSATYEIETKNTDSGIIKTLKLTATVTKIIPEMYKNLVICLDFCDGTVKRFGSSYVPVRINFTEEQPIKISIEYSFL